MWKFMFWNLPIHNIMLFYTFFNHLESLPGRQLVEDNTTPFSSPNDSDSDTPPRSSHPTVLYCTQTGIPGVCRSWCHTRPTVLPVVGWRCIACRYCMFQAAVLLYATTLYIPPCFGQPHTQRPSPKRALCPLPFSVLAGPQYGCDVPLDSNWHRPTNASWTSGHVMSSCLSLSRVIWFRHATSTIVFSWVSTHRWVVMFPDDYDDGLLVLLPSIVVASLRVVCSTSPYVL
jgi:hypothetical protein